MKDSGWVYIMTNRKNGVLYTGVTHNLEKRVQQHREKQMPGFTQKYNLTKLIYYESHQMFTDAIDREKLIKKKSRKGKIKLIESLNPLWNDLALQVFGNRDLRNQFAEIPDGLRPG